MSDIYYSPENHGIEIVGELEQEPDYDFHKFVVWRDLKNKNIVYYATDSGCSCPMPFENFGGPETLTRVESRGALRSAAKAWIAELYERHGNPTIEEAEALVSKVNPRK